MSAEMPVRILTTHFNRSDLLRIQHRAIQLFLTDANVELIVFDDSTYEHKSLEMQQTCLDLHIQYIRIPPEIHTRPYQQRWADEPILHASVRCSNGVQYAFDHFGKTFSGILCMFDADLFPMNYMNLNKMLAHHDILTTMIYTLVEATWKIQYMWCGFVILNTGKVPGFETLSFNSGYVIDGILKGESSGWRIDSGGDTYNFLKRNKHLKYLNYTTTNTQNRYEDTRLPAARQEISNFLQEDLRLYLVYSKHDEYPYHVHKFAWTLGIDWIHFVGGSGWSMPDFMPSHCQECQTAGEYYAQRVKNMNSMLDVLAQQPRAVVTEDTIGESMKYCFELPLTESDFPV